MFAQSLKWNKFGVTEGFAIGLMLASLAIAPQSFAQDSDVLSFESEAEAIQARMASYPQGDSVRNFEWFQPGETGHGADAPELLADKADHALLASNGLNEEMEFAAGADSNALIVWHKGAIRYENYFSDYGMSDRTWSQSMHKSVVSILVGIAIDRGLIESVDDPASRYLLEWQGTDRDEVTIRQLLTMTSGLQLGGGSNIGMPFGLRVGLSNDIERAALDAALIAGPGREFEYSNVNPQVLLAILERASGMRYTELLQEWLWAPIGAAPAQLWLDRPRGVARAANSLAATPRDWLRVGLLFLNDGQISGRQVVSKEWIDATTTPSQLSGNYGFLTWLGSPESGSRSFGTKNTFSVRHSAPFLSPDMVYFDGVGGQRV